VLRASAAITNGRSRALLRQISTTEIGWPA
jgi:hypothetical protein